MNAQNHFEQITDQLQGILDLLLGGVIFPDDRSSQSVHLLKDTFIESAVRMNGLKSWVSGLARQEANRKEIKRQIGSLKDTLKNLAGADETQPKERSQ